MARPSASSNVGQCALGTDALVGPVRPLKLAESILPASICTSQVAELIERLLRVNQSSRSCGPRRWFFAFCVQTPIHFSDDTDLIVLDAYSMRSLQQVFPYLFLLAFVLAPSAFELVFLFALHGHAPHVDVNSTCKCSDPHCGSLRSSTNTLATSTYPLTTPR